MNFLKLFIFLFFFILNLNLFAQKTAQPTKKTNSNVSEKKANEDNGELLKLLNSKEVKDTSSNEKEKEEKVRLEFLKEKEEFEKQREIFLKEKEEFDIKKSQETKEEEDAKKEEDFFKLEEEISIVSKQVGKSENTSKTSAIVSVYNRQKIADSGARNLADILKQVPGVEVSYDQFGFYKVAFRGILSRSGVLMLLDNHRINNFYDGSTFLDIRADAIEKVEIIRGPGSSIHGTNAFLGVINVITRVGVKRDKSGGHISNRLGQYNTFEPTAYYNLNFGNNWNFNTYVGQFQSQRPQIHIPYDQSCTKVIWSSSNSQCSTTLIPQPIAYYNKTNDRKRQTNVFLSLNKGDSFYLNGKMIREERGPNVGELGFITPNSQIGFTLLTADIGTKKIEITEKLSFSARLYGDTYLRRDEIEVERKDFSSHLGVSPFKQTGYKYQTSGIEAILQFDPISQLSIMIGGQVEKLSYKDAYLKQNYVGENTSKLYPVFYDYDNLNPNLIDTALQYQQTGRLSLSDTESYKISRDKHRNISAQFIQIIWNPAKWLSITTGVRRDIYSDFGSTVNPKTGIVITPFEKTKFGTLAFKFLFGSAFRAPTFQEMYDKGQTFQVGGIFGNNTQRIQNLGNLGYGALKPETIQTGEVGMEYSTPYKPLSVLANWFYNKISNNIDGINTSGTLPGRIDLYRNLRGITIIGSELEFRLNYNTRNYAFANMSWFQAIDNGGLIDNLNQDTKTILTSIPQGRANLGLNWSISRYFILNNTIWASTERRSNVRFAFERQSTRGFQYPQYHIWNLSLATTEDLIKNMELRINVFNLQDFKLYDPSNTATVNYVNRSIPAAYIFQRYIEFKLTYFL